MRANTLPLRARGDGEAAEQDDGDLPWQRFRDRSRQRARLSFANGQAVEADHLLGMNFFYRNKTA